MSIQTELSRIINAKAAIKAAIEGKGVTVPDTTLLDGMASLIESIEAGGGGGDNQSPLKIAHASITAAQKGVVSVNFSDAGITKPYLLCAKLAEAFENVDNYCILEDIYIKRKGTYGEYTVGDSAFNTYTYKKNGAITFSAPSSSATSQVFGYSSAGAGKNLTVKDGFVYVYFEKNSSFSRLNYGHEYDVYLIGY